MELFELETEEAIEKNVLRYLIWISEGPRFPKCGKDFVAARNLGNLLSVTTSLISFIKVSVGFFITAEKWSVEKIINSVLCVRIPTV